MFKVELDLVKKDLHKLPKHIVEKLNTWVFDVELHGLYEVRKIPSYHDEPLKGNRKGQRSIRLNKAYRAIYTTTSEGTVTLVIVEEVNKHEY